MHHSGSEFQRVAVKPVSPPARGPQENAQRILSRPQLVGIGVGVGGLLVIQQFTSLALVLAAVAAMIGVYSLIFLWRVITTSVSLGDSTIQFSSKEIEQVRRSGSLPSITIMAPICRENEEIIAQQAQSFACLDYPRHLLQIIVLVDADDHLTYELADKYLPDWVSLLSVPVEQPRTKPRVLNYGLSFATGQVVGVLDGEDVPEPAQLLKVAAAFAKLPPEVMCVQGRLIFRHPETNLLTRWAQVAYHSTFSLYLPALARMGLPVPLGGTSNYIDAEVLRQLGGWDQWNVTEDLDLGVRLARAGWGIRVIDAVTEEEPNDRLSKCLNQWSRWEKGKIQTWLVGMRHPLQLWQDLGWKGFGAFHLTVGVPILMLLANPIFMLMTVGYYLSNWLTTSSLPIDGSPAVEVFIEQMAEFSVATITTLFPGVVLYLGSLCLIAGNAFFIWTAATGALYRKQYGLVPAALLLPIHGLLLSAAAYKGLWQILSKRAHFWELTPHRIGGGSPSPTLVSAESYPVNALADD